MARGIGEFDLIQETIPEWLAVVIALLTQLGDVWFLVLVLTVFYWVDAPNRDDIAAVAGVTLAGMGLYRGLKEVFGLPRPELYYWIQRCCRGSSSRCTHAFAIPDPSEDERPVSN